MALVHYRVDVMHLGTWERSWGYAIAAYFSTDPPNVVRLSFFRWQE